MNRLLGRIVAIEAAQGLSLIDIQTRGTHIAAIVLETPETSEYLRQGREVWVLFKETEVALGLDEGRTSYLNVLDGRIAQARVGKVVAEVSVWTQAGEVTSIITRRSFERLGLKEGDRVKAIIKSTEVALEGVEAP